jgi:hypothetical protein
MTRRARITVADVSRVIKAAAKSGERTIIEIEADGRIVLILGDERAAKKPVKEIATL